MTTARVARTSNGALESGGARPGRSATIAARWPAKAVPKQRCRAPRSRHRAPMSRAGHRRWARNAAAVDCRTITGMMPITTAVGQNIRQLAQFVRGQIPILRLAANHNVRSWSCAAPVISTMRGAYYLLVGEGRKLYWPAADVPAGVAASPGRLPEDDVRTNFDSSFSNRTALRAFIAPTSSGTP